MSSSAFWTPGLEILTSILAPFSGSMAGWSTRTSMSAQRPIRRASSYASRRGRVRTGMSSRVCLPYPGRLRTRFRRASCFCTDYRGHTLACITAFWPHAGKRSCAQSGCWRQEAGGNPKRRAHWRCRVSAVGADVVAQVSGGFVDVGECEGALRGCCGSESCQVLGVFTSFSPDGLELGQGRP